VRFGQAAKTHKRQFVPKAMPKGLTVSARNKSAFVILDL
jgi:hypothetical protein